jgi:hypothetical protein
MQPTETFTFHVAKPTPALRDREVIVPAGRALGGGSSVNCMTMKVISMFDGQTDIVITGIKFFTTQGQRPRITTIGKTYMEIKDGVLSI